MILTFQKADLLKKLRKAKTDEVAAIKRKNAEIADEFAQWKADNIATAEKYITKLRATKTAKRLDLTRPMEYFRASEPKPEVSTRFDGAIGLLEACAEETITINSVSDKLGLADAVRAAVGD